MGELEQRRDIGGRDAQRFGHRLRLAGIISRLVSTLYRRARYTAEMRRKLGTPGTAALRDLAIELYENPGARRIWEAHSENEIAYFETMAPNDVWRRSYRDEILAELAKLDSVKE